MRLLIVFLEEPLPPHLEPSLAGIVGTDRADVVSRAAMRLLLTQLSGLEKCNLRFCFRPPDAHDAVRFWLLSEIMEQPDIHVGTETVDFQPQPDGDLSTRISHAAGHAFREGYQKIALIGSHCLEISNRWIHATFAQLNKKNAAVIGPTQGGACCLFAMQQHLPSLCSNISWTNPGSAERTIHQASREEIALYQLPKLPALGSLHDYRSALSGSMGPRFLQAIEDILESG